MLVSYLLLPTSICHNQLSGNRALPSDIAGLVEKEFLFKVKYTKQTNLQFGPSFSVKKSLQCGCSDLEIQGNESQLCGQL